MPAVQPQLKFGLTPEQVTTPRLQRNTMAKTGPSDQPQNPDIRPKRHVQTYRAPDLQPRAPTSPEWIGTVTQRRQRTSVLRYPTPPYSDTERPLEEAEMADRVNYRPFRIFISVPFREGPMCPRLHSHKAVSATPPAPFRSGILEGSLRQLAPAHERGPQ